MLGESQPNPARDDEAANLKAARPKTPWRWLLLVLLQSAMMRWTALSFEARVGGNGKSGKNEQENGQENIVHGLWRGRLRKRCVCL
ncbi:hypothetical protein [Desulfarculus baarsii]